jgi:hypothetical protein
MAVLGVDELYHMHRNVWNPSMGITGKSRYTNFKRFKYTEFNINANKGSNQTAYPWEVDGYPYQYNWQRTINVYGFFVPPREGLYTFYLASDDAGYTWLQSNAINYSRQNASMDNGGVHGTTMRKTQILVPGWQVGYPIPIRIIQGDQGGENTLVFGFLLPGETEVRYDLGTICKH